MNAIEGVAKGLELKDTANNIEWVVKEVDVDGTTITRIEGIFDNRLDVPIEGLKTILTLYDVEGEEMGKQVAICGIIHENNERILSFDVSEEFKGFDSFTVELEYDDYSTENTHTIETDSATEEYRVRV